MTNEPEETNESIADFIARTGLTMESQRIESRSDGVNWDRGTDNRSSHWRATLHRGDESMTLEYSMGPAHLNGPEIADVLDCIASDVAGIENASSFEDWAADYGYDPDSRKAFATYQAIEAQRAELRNLLFVPVDEPNRLSRYNADVFEALLWHTERL